MIHRPFSGAKAKTAPAARGLFMSFMALIVMGLVVLYAASFYNAQDKGNPFSEVMSQGLGVALGAAGMIVISSINYRVLNNPWIVGGLVGVSIALLAMVAIPGIGQSINGSRRWLRLGPVSFQPSEMAKYAVIIYLARALSVKSRDMGRLITGVAPLFALPAIIFALILLQPNLSTAGSIIIVAAIMVMQAGAKWKHLSLVGCAGAAVGAFYALSEDYRRERLMSFANPWKYASDEGYQLAQSLISFGSGGLFGMGLGKGRQKYAFLPYPESDFIFAVVGEDMGFAGCVLVICLFAAFAYFAFRIAISSEDRFGSLLAGGIGTMITTQCVLNMAVVLGLMPTTGLPLPFFSSGGTSVAIVMCATALILNVSRNGR